MSKKVTPPECAQAAEIFDHFCSAGTMKQLLAVHREICSLLSLKPDRLPEFYPKLKKKLASSWKAQALFKKLDVRAGHKVYGGGRTCCNCRVLVIGAGPCGLRAAIECQLLGAKVVVVEKRDRISRNNVLHLWPFVIQDLRALGAKKFFGKFCAGSIDHISIRQLQLILMKVALLLGVELHEGVSFEDLIEPTMSHGWRARVQPEDSPVGYFDFDVLVGADGKRNTLQGFTRKEFRGKLALAITANFINRQTEREAAVPEISGVAFIFNQKFFKELYAATGIDLENIVYYKDDTHYFVMTAKKQSLHDKGVLIKDYTDVSRLLSPDNVNREALMEYAREAARFSTEDRLPKYDFALNHYGDSDVALFDFTSMYAAENASMVMERRGRRLLCQLVGDSLLEPFWPTGSGCARGFLSALDAAWAVRSWAQVPAPHPLHVVAEREGIYRLLAQTTPENLNRDLGAYTLDPATRYPNLNRMAVSPHRVASYYDSDQPLPLDTAPAPRKRRREGDMTDEMLIAWTGAEAGSGLRVAVSAETLSALLHSYRPELISLDAPSSQVFDLLRDEFGILPPPEDATDSKLRSFLSRLHAVLKAEVPRPQVETQVIPRLLPIEENLISTEQSICARSSTGDGEKSHSSNRKKRRSLRTTQVSIDPAECVRRKVGRLAIEDVARLASLMEGPTLPDISHLFRDDDPKPIKPSRKLKGLDPKTIRVPDFTDFNDPMDTDATMVPSDTEERYSPDLPLEPEISSPSPIGPARRKSSEEISQKHLTNGSSISYRRSKSLEFILAEYVPPVERVPRPKPQRKRTPELEWTPMAERMRYVTEVLAGKQQGAANYRKYEPEPVTTANVTARRKRMVELIDGRPEPVPDDQAMLKWTRSLGRRKAARQITLRRFEKSLQMLLAEPRVDIAPSTDLEHDYGLQQYRASAPHFDERVRQLECKLLHHGKTIAPGTGAKVAAGGARVAKLAAKLAASSPPDEPAPRPTKPKDLLRSVGRLDREDWNMKEIERKILENRMGRPEPRAAERVPKWDREQFLGRQRRLKHGDDGDNKWVDVDSTLHKVEQKLRDSGRPAHGTRKVADLATKFVKKDIETEEDRAQPKDEVNKRRAWHGPSSSGAKCVTCGKRVFAAEAVTADGLQLHRACFRCVVCGATLRPGSYTMRIIGRPVCLRHKSAILRAYARTPERISLELSDGGVREIDEDEWTDRNCLPSETSPAGGLSDDEESDSDEYADAGDGEVDAVHSPEPQHPTQQRPPRSQLYLSDDSFGYDDYSDDGGDSSGNESCSRMREAREARRREVPADRRPPTDSSEVESEADSESSEESESSATEVSTDSEFGREDPAPPAILVTEPSQPPPLQPLPRRDFALHKALELKRKYLLGDPAPPVVIKSHSASHIDGKLEAFRSNITEFQKLLHPAATPTPLPFPSLPITTLRTSGEGKAQPMPDIIKNLCVDAPLDLLAEGPRPERSALSDRPEGSSTTAAPARAVPRLEVHDEGGRPVRLESPLPQTANEIPDDSETSESELDATTLALTETEPSDWAGEGLAFDDCAIDEERRRARNPRTLSSPKRIGDVETPHVCGRTGPAEPLHYYDALERCRFADEGDRDPSLEAPVTHLNRGYMQLVEHGNDRSIDYVERELSETVAWTPPPALTPTSTSTERNDDRLRVDEVPVPSDSPSLSEVSSPAGHSGADAFSIRLYAPAMCRSASDTITVRKVQEIKKERDEQTELVRRLVLERLGGGPRAPRKSVKRLRMPPMGVAPLPLPPPSPPPRPAPPPPSAPKLLSAYSSEPELARKSRGGGSIMRSISDYFNRRLSARHKERAPPVPPPPRGYRPPPGPGSPRSSRTP